ncbi:MAG: methyltransferase domain-containing protein [Verrucomicrobia bacterium]|nr:methyltransferase domain-containing protein [Verrucomicrobiota bacterium]
MSTPDNSLAEFRALVADRLGLWFEEHRWDFLTGVLRERSTAHGRDLLSYLQGLASPGSRDEWQTLACLLTINETYFMRGGDHLGAFVSTVLPARLSAPPAGRPLRFLSAGCSSGEEAYSLAIALREHQLVPAHRSVQIIGVDINRAVLAKARSGRYSAWSLRETPPEIRAKYFHADKSDFVLDDSILGMVTFFERNLSEPNDDLWQPGSFDAVFCRNMLMYLVPEVAADIVARIQRALAPGGFLFLGHAETLRGISQGFHLRRNHGAFYYQLRGEDEAAPAAFPFEERRSEPIAPAPVLPTPEGGPAASTAWMEEIDRASQRIARLSTQTGPSAPVTAPAARSNPGAHFDRALDLHRQERFTEALAHLAEQPAGSAPDAELLVLQAMLLVNSGRLDEAEALCRPLLSTDDLNAGVRYVIALCREHAGDLANALEHDEAAAYLDPSFAMPRFHLGLVCKRLGRVLDARGHFEAALALLVKEDPVRLLLFGGGFSRETLVQACRGELHQLHSAA